MAVVRKKQDDKNLKVLRELSAISGNKQCFDCGQRGPTYINMTIGSFVCTRCSGILRGLTPPQRVKSISMATFTTEEIDFIRAHGNEDCAKTWMGLWDPKRTITQDHRELMVDKYERKRYYLEPASPLKSIQTSSSQQLTSSNTSQSNTTDNMAALKAINLTPPSTLHLFKNNSPHHHHNQQHNVVAAAAVNQSSNANQQQQQINSTTNHFQTQFTPDDSNNSLFNQQQTQQQIRLNNNINNNNNNNINNNNQHHHHLQHHNNNVNGINRNGLNIASNNQQQQQSLKNGFGTHLQQQQQHTIGDQKFTPDSDFVADFGKASIFNATNNNNNNVKLNNLNHHQQQQQQNLKNSGQLNGKLMSNGGGGSGGPRVTSNGIHPSMTNGGAPTGNGENFADFEHNAIYNAAVVPATNPTNSNATRWNNVWPEFQWPLVQPEQNRWSLPMSISSSNSLNSSGTFNSSSSLNSTPSADRYAALKDLDEQFKEIKEKETTNVFNTNGVPASAVAASTTQSTANAGTAINPFKNGGQPTTNTAAPHFSNPFQHQQQVSASQAIPQQQQMQTGGGGWPIVDQGFNQQQAQMNGVGLFQQQTPPNMPATNFTGSNGFGSQLNMQPVGYNTGFTQQSMMNSFNGFHQQPAGLIATGNPFAMGSAESKNNPFL